jgi:transcriptional regulator with XRE-family HTH domain
MTQADLATRANVNRLTLSRLERGELTVSLDLLFRVLGVLGLEADLDNIARDDELGRQLQDALLYRPVQRKQTAR